MTSPHNPRQFHILGASRQGISTAFATRPGHTDSKGSDEYNLALFDRRAEAVRAWLASHGIKDAAITTEDRGESEPVAPNVHDDGSDNSEGRQLNRRAEFVVSSE